jgi:hypothetical protein
MNNAERKEFWDSLCSIRDNQPEHIQSLLARVKMPRYLCRFRTVSEDSLNQLQENKLYYSSADHYDDPFDTFIHVDLARIREWYSLLSEDVNSDNPVIMDTLKKMETVIGIEADQFLANLKNNSLDLSSFPERIKQIRNIIQKNLFSICFCSNALNETLWLKYANNYRGFALVYDVKDESTFLCGKESFCKNCRSMLEKPFIYPVYYTEKAYDATKYALACLLWTESEKVPPQILDLSYKAVMWEAERISLIKKKCHEYDDEWRMIRPTMASVRSYIKMKPYKVILGLRMPEYERLLVISAAKVAGVNSIEELYIDDFDNLSTRELIQV